jgi:PadR family transcriptional regulator PadR
MAAVPREPSPEPPLLPKVFLRASVLILLHGQPCHGYELLDQLRQLGMTGVDTGGLYRSLRSMEEDGLVCSRWETSPSGPPRRSYTLSTAGQVALEHAVTHLAQVRDCLDQLVGAFAESRRGRTAR